MASFQSRSRSVFGFDLAHPHPSHDGLITDFNIRINAQIVPPNRIQSALRPAIRRGRGSCHPCRISGVFRICAGYYCDVGHDDALAVLCVAQGGAFGTTTLLR